MNINLEYYRTFLMTANTLSFTNAAKHLCLTQSAVSQTIKKLETELGTQLFLRTTQGLQLTKEGEVLYLHIKNAFQEIQTAEQQIMQLGELETGELQIGATETTIRFLLAPLLQKFKDRFPNIRITFTGSTTIDTCKNLSNGDIEIAFLISPLSSAFNLQLTKIGELRDIFIASTQFALDWEKTYTPKEIATFPFITVNSDNSVRRYYDTWFMEQDVVLSPDYTVRNTGLVLPLVENHLGISILPYDYVADHIQNNKIAEIKTTCKPPARSIYIATNQDASTSTIGREFISFITEQLA